MKRRNWKIYFLVLAVGLISLFKIEAASAQLSISLYPLSFKAKVNPGDSWEGKVTVVNPNDFAIGIRPEKENLFGGAEGEVQLTGETGQDYGLASWISFDTPKEFTLAPRERREVSFTLKIPANAQPGGHYGAALFRGLTLDKGGTPGNGVGIAGRVGSVLLFEVSGDVKRVGEISEITAPKFLSHGPINVSFKVKNDGNTFFAPEGKVVFRHLWQKYEGAWEPRVVFPGYDRTFRTSWNQKYYFGPVKVTVMASLPEGLTFAEKSVIVWVFPWLETIIILAVLLIVWLGIKIFKKKFKIVRLEP